MARIYIKTREDARIYIIKRMARIYIKTREDVEYSIKVTGAQDGKRTRGHRDG